MPPTRMNNSAVETVIRVLDENGEVSEELEGIGMQF